MPHPVLKHVVKHKLNLSFGFRKLLSSTSTIFFPFSTVSSRVESGLNSLCQCAQPTAGWGGSLSGLEVNPPGTMRYLS